MNKQGPGKIDWTDWTWNPVTGCYHGCPYCYARRIAERFAGHRPEGTGERPVLVHEWDYTKREKAFASGFTPTFYPHRMAEPVLQLHQRAKVFVCSMADLFGDWVPDAWVEQILEHVRAYQHNTYQFLTKAPERLARWNPWPANCWVGATATDEASMARALRALESVQATVRYVSAEPLLGPLFGMDSGGLVPAVPPAGATRPLDWLILGADTTRGAARPEPGWVMQASCAAALDGMPVWHKDSLCSPVHSAAQLKRWPVGVGGG